MPFPWKKVKSTRISQFVNDHLHNSQRRRDGSSLVVETGFPTSLVDLFMKNRQKLKKPSKKKRQIPPIAPLSDDNDPITPRSPTSLPSATPMAISPHIDTGSRSPRMHSPLSCPSPLRSPLHLSLPSGSVDRIVVVDERERVVERGVDANMVLLVVLKMFLVVMVALGTKRLTVGITISAFLLLFLEYVGKHANGLLNRCSAIKSVVQSVRRSLGFKSVVLKPELQQELLLNTESSSLERHGSISPGREIEVVEREINFFVTCVDEIQPVKEVADASRFNGRSENREIKLQEVEVEVEKEESMYKVEDLKKKSRRAKIKSKMKNLVPKKLRSRKKEHSHDKCEIVSEDSFSLCDERRLDQWEGESENASELSSVSSRRYKEEDGMITVYASNGFSDISEEASVKKDDEIEGSPSWKYLVLGVIVLLGLVRGRVFALLLTVSWLLLLKISKTLPMYATKVPIIRSLCDKKSV